MFSSFSLANALSTKISADERNFENINESCRPSVIRGEYTTFCSKQWLRAKKELDATKHALLDEQMKCEILAKILEVNFQSSGFKIGMLVAHLKCMLYILYMK